MRAKDSRARDLQDVAMREQERIKSTLRDLYYLNYNSYQLYCLVPDTEEPVNDEIIEKGWVEAVKYDDNIEAITNSIETRLMEMYTDMKLLIDRLCDLKYSEDVPF